MRRAAWILLVLLLAWPASAGEIVLKDGKVLECTGIRATAEKVTFKLGGSTQNRPAAEVARVYPDGDRNLERAIRLIKRNDDAKKIAEVLRRVLSRGEEDAKPYAQFFLAELYHRYNRHDTAIKEYDETASKWPKHFYAPVAVYRAAQLADGAGATKRYEDLASGKYGSDWKEVGQYGLARSLLLSGNHAKAKSAFAALSSARDTGLQDLASAGEAHCRLLGGDARGAERTFKQIISRSKNAEALGYAHYGLGVCLEKAGKQDEAMLAYLRSLLLYPSGPERNSAAKAAAELTGKLRLGGDRRLLGLGQSAPYDDYMGDSPDVELMRRALQHVSAGIVQKFAPELEKKQRKKEDKASLAFLGADAMKIVARATNDPNLLKEYEERLKALRKEYPNHDRAALAGVDAFMAAKDRALALIAQADEEGDPEKKQALLEEGRGLFAKVLEPFRGSIKAMTEEVNKLLELGERGELTPEQQQEKQQKEFQRDLSEFLLAEAYGSYAKTFPEGSEERKKNFEEALKLYNFYIEDRGNFQKLLFYSYVGRGEMLMELERFEDAIAQFEELTFAEPMFVPRDPEGKKAVEDMVKDVVIRAYYGWVRALLKAGKAAEAFEASQAIDDHAKTDGWEKHPMGILLTFERAKALAGSGRGAAGARELYEIIERAKNAPDGEKIPALGMSRIGAGACRALSELSDLTGGEVYSPEIQYYVGVGYFLRGKTELAIAGYKGVLTAARSKAEREQWVPKSVREIGNMLFQQERFLEAALAYETVFKEFPDHELAEEAVRFAVAASKKAIEQFGDDPTDSSSPLVEFARRIETGSVTAAGPIYEAKLILKSASDLHKKQRWAQAAEEYLRIKAEVPDEEGKGTIKVPFYANAIANAGYCYFQAYRKDKDEAFLSKARSALKKATEAANTANDQDSEALACFYLGQLENTLGKPDAALTALRPFDGPLATSKYLVRARYQQALAYFEQDDVRNAEKAFQDIADKTSDQFYGQFAYTMASRMRVAAGKAKEVEETRSLRRKAAKYISHWNDADPIENQREPVVFWAADTLFQGGDYRGALAAYSVALKKFERPELKDAKSMAAHENFDTAELAVGYSNAMLGNHKEALEQLTRMQNVIYVYRGSGERRRPERRGIFVERKLKGPFAFKRAGRTFNQKAWFTVLESGDQTVEYFDHRGPRADVEFYGVEVTSERRDPTASYDPNTDVRTLQRPYKGDYLVVDGIAKASWALWEAEKDQNFLANEVTAAINELVYVLRGMESSYPALASRYQIEPVDYSLALWRAQLQFLRVKMARQNWRGVASDLRLMKMQNKLDKAPPEIRAELERMLAEAEKKGGN